MQKFSAPKLSLSSERLNEKPQNCKPRTEQIISVKSRPPDKHGSPKGALQKVTSSSESGYMGSHIWERVTSHIPEAHALHDKAAT